MKSKAMRKSSQPDKVDSSGLTPTLKQSRLPSRIGSILAPEGRLCQKQRFKHSRIKVIAEARANAGPGVEYWVDCQEKTVRITPRLRSGWKPPRQQYRLNPIQGQHLALKVRPDQNMPQSQSSYQPNPRYQLPPFQQQQQ
ncbi:hypothetical protein CR513_45937, partial [Mucuna pruriens]